MDAHARFTRCDVRYANYGIVIIYMYIFLFEFKNIMMMKYKYKRVGGELNTHTHTHTQHISLCNEVLIVREGREGELERERKTYGENETVGRGGWTRYFFPGYV